jgi:hypothetical protein
MCMAKGTFNCLFILQTARSGFNQVGTDTPIRRQQFSNGHLKNKCIIFPLFDINIAHNHKIPMTCVFFLITPLYSICF